MLPLIRNRITIGIKFYSQIIKINLKAHLKDTSELIDNTDNLYGSSPYSKQRAFSE